MKRLFAFCIILILFPLSVLADSYQVVGEGDSIMVGFGGATNGPLPSLCGYLSKTYIDRGVNGSCITGVNSLLSSDLSAYTPERVYCDAGINDIRTWGVSCESTRTQWLGYYDSFKTSVEGASATLYPMLITPMGDDPYFPGNDPRGTIKLWNAYLEEWGYLNNNPVCPTHQDMGVNVPATSSTTDDTLKNTADGLHPNETGDGILGYLMYNSDIPNRSRDWGNADYPKLGHESWSWWIITGTGSVADGSTDGVTGYNDGGTLSLSQSASAVSNVLCFIPTGGNTISLSATATQGAVTIKYRTSANNFYRATSEETIAWTTYSAPFETTDNYIQVQLSNSDATTALVDVITLDWSGSVPAGSTASHFGGSGVGINR